MDFQLILIISFFFAIGWLIIFFHSKKKEIIQLHSTKMETLKNEISLNHHQIIYRHSYLERYHFLKYNISEALVVQPKIIVH